MFIKIAHRGASAYHVENTVNAVKEAIYQKADMVEIDVRVSKDNVPVIFHDPNLKRVARRKALIKNLSFHDLRYIKLKNNEKIPSLDEVLSVAKGKIKVLLDIKVSGIEQEIVDSIKKRKMEKYVLISSKKPNVLKKIKEINPGLKLALIFRFRKSHIMTAKKLGCYSIHPNHLGVTKYLLKLAKKNNLRVHPYSVNRSKRMKQLIREGVNGIITDKPVLLRNVLYSLGQSV